MRNPLTQIKKVFIHDEAWNSRVAQRALNIFSAGQCERVDSAPFSQRTGTLSAQEYTESKTLLYIAPHRGAFFKRCPGAKPGLTCCNYFVLNLGLQCNMDCSYCYLQSFINFPLMTIYSNIDMALAELKARAAISAQEKFRIGTGEVIDSLSLDEISLYSRELIEFFQTVPQWQLELKTKSDKVDQFLDVPHAGNVVISWSMNPQYVIDREEHNTASLQERLTAARKCRDKGFVISFHLDPLIYHPDWKENYALLVDEICTAFSPQEVHYLSAGGLRFQPEQRHLMRERFGSQSLVTSAEVFPSRDGKLRYDRQMREEMFRFVIERFKARSSEWRVFLCMETPEAWIGTYNQMPKGSGEFTPLFDYQSVRQYKNSQPDPLAKELSPC